MKPDISATARVRLVIEVPTSCWGIDCTVEQIMDQASREATIAVQNMIAKAGGRIIGEPEVIATIGIRRS